MTAAVLPPNLYQSTKVITDYVNANTGDNRYTELSAMLVIIVESAKLDIEDKHDILADISDYLDGLKPSAKSGLPIKKKRA